MRETRSYARFKWFTILGLVLLLSNEGCGQAQCLRQSDCPPPSQCKAGRCKLPARHFDEAGAVPTVGDDDDRAVFDASVESPTDAAAPDAGALFEL